MTTKQTSALRAAMASLATMPIERLRAQYEHAFEKPAGKQRRDLLVRTLAERATGMGGATKPTSAPAPTAPAKPTPKPRKPATRKRDERLPAVGGTIEKVFKGKTLRVEVTADGLRHAGRDWSSLTALALHLTGYAAISGPAFFGLTKPAAEKPATPATPRKARKG